MNDIATNTSKVCRKCNELKPLSEFGLNKGFKDNHNSKCKECERKRAMEKYFKNKARYAQNSLQWRTKNKERANAISRASQKKNRIACKELRDKIAFENPCCICKESRIGCLDFHHLDPSTKNKVINRATSVPDFFKEVVKCIVLCANCHRLVHAGSISLPANIQPIQI